jgi:hypothetical protein
VNKRLQCKDSALVKVGAPSVTTGAMRNEVPDRVLRERLDLSSLVSPDERLDPLRQPHPTMRLERPNLLPNEKASMLRLAFSRRAPADTRPGYLQTHGGLSVKVTGLAQKIQVGPRF